MSDAGWQSRLSRPPADGHWRLEGDDGAAAAAPRAFNGRVLFGQVGTAPTQYPRAAQNVRFSFNVPPVERVNVQG